MIEPAVADIAWQHLRMCMGAVHIRPAPAGHAPVPRPLCCKA